MAATTGSKRPNFLIIVADDLGFSDTGPYGSEISTPSLDRLAKDGLRMTDFHTAAACSPTRAMLLSGTDNHVAGLGQMVEFIANSPHKAQLQGRPGYEGFLNFRVAAVSEILQDAGYLTIHSGKWHLGMTPETAPSARGFTKSLSFLPGAGNHYNYEPQFDSHRVPAFMKSDNFWMKGTKLIDRENHLPKDFYSTDFFADQLIEFLNERTEEEKKENPFFAYLAFTAPHWPLQAPQDLISKYADVYNDGPDALRLRRLEQLQKLGLVPEDIVPAPVHAESKAWEDMDSAERASSSRKMTVYAAMVDRMDTKIGHVLDALEASSELDNTFVLFMSDNGAEGSLLESLPMFKHMALNEVLEKWYDNSLENVGKANSFIWYGDRWALAATAPSRGFKGSSTEGGIRCPCIVRFPALAKSSSGGYTHEFGSVMDILPTCLDLAGIQHPGSTFRGREVVPVRGRSWVPFLSGKSDDIHATGQTIAGWELFGVRAIRRGDWKAVYLPPPKGKDRWELYNLVKDPGETDDLAESETEIFQQLLVDWQTYIAETGAVELEIGGKKIHGQ